MTSYVALLRGINVGGRNPIAMPALAESFRDAGFHDVRTYSQSGNVLFAADPAADPELETAIEATLLNRFDTPILAVVRSRDELAATIAAAPADHGSRPCAATSTSSRTRAPHRRPSPTCRSCATASTRWRWDPAPSTSPGSRRRRGRPGSRASWPCRSSSR